jgi:hypothetical protein
VNFVRNRYPFSLTALKVKLTCSRHCWNTHKKKTLQP